MPRVIGIDPGTVSIDLCGLDDGHVVLDEAIPTADALREPDAFVERLRAAGPVDLVAGPSGYGLPFITASDLTDEDYRLAYLAPPGETGGIGGLRALVRTLVRASIPMVMTPGVVHLASVPAHRKVNRVDMGTADKVCAAVLAVREQAARRGCAAGEVSFVMLELGGAFTAAIAVHEGRIVDGIGGTSGPMGIRAAGALDGEVAYLAGAVSKASLFTGGAAFVAGQPGASADSLWDARTPQARLARDAYLEAAAKAVASLAVSVPALRHVVLSGRLAGATTVRREIEQRLTAVIDDVTVQVLSGFATVAKQAAQGAALLADGLAGGTAASLVATMEIRRASGTVLDHLYVVTRDAARARLGLA
jgi:predicted butyrate kinase (DUF1464 family)